jgi:hypothetical protein
MYIVFMMNGCMRDDRDELYMCMLLSATLKNILKDKEKEYEENKFEKVKGALQYVQNKCYIIFPDYIKNYFLPE